MRLFIAADINQKLKKWLAALEHDLRQKTNLAKHDAKWVEPDNIHITIQFLGEVSDQDAVRICEITQKTAAEHQIFDVDIGGLGVFGSPARVLWVGINARDSLNAFERDLQNRLSQAGWPGDNREFSPHLTLCRIKSASAGIQIKKLIDGYKASPFGPMAVDAICVYKSQLTSAGTVYTLVRKGLLQK